MQDILDIILPVFVIVGCGYFAAWKGWFSDSAVEGLMKFTQSFAIPCLIFRAISTLDLNAATNTAMILSFYSGAIASFLLGLVASRLFLGRNMQDAIAIGFCCFFSNSVLFGLPITERAYGSDALSGNFAIIAFHAPLLYLIGVTAMELARGGATSIHQMTGRVFEAMFHNPIVIAIVLGFIANLTSLPIPAPILTSIDFITDAALPTALFGLGGVLIRYKPEGDMKTILMICCISLIIHPAISFGIGTYLVLDQASLRSAVLTASMAPGVNAYIFANIYGAAPRAAAASVLIATVASVFTIWFWLSMLP